MFQNYSKIDVCFPQHIANLDGQILLQLCREKWGQRWKIYWKMYFHSILRCGLRGNNCRLYLTMFKSISPDVCVQKSQLSSPFCCMEGKSLLVLQKYRQYRSMPLVSRITLF